ncbi:MAG: AMP-binding protein [Bacteroidetes bacterium]|jgi:long-chain acyl-CoA synthetase|nr:AMP-binding protein [Bacteroidota bacterium]
MPTYAPRTLFSLVDEGLATMAPDAVCLATKRNRVWTETGRRDVQRQIRQFALGLYALGVRKGDRVALHAENSTRWVIVDQAVLSLGAVTVPIYATQPGDQIAFILNNAEASVYVVSTEALFDHFAPHAENVSSLETTIGLYGTFSDGMLAYEDVLERGAAQDAETPNLFEQRRATVQPGDLASLVYTSGTTGKPKGVMLTHNNIASNARASLERIPFSQDEEGAMLSYLPLSHVFERMLSILYLYAGYPIYFVEDYNEILEDLRTVRPLHFSTVPRLLEKVYMGIRQRADESDGLQGVLLRWAVGLAEQYELQGAPSAFYQMQFALADLLVYQRLRERFGGRLQGITSGSAALSPRVMTFINAIGIFCGQGYGMTETSPVISVYEKGDLRAGSVGTPVTDVEVRIADDGEIVVRGPNVMQGYYKRPQSTAEVLQDDGWLRTGDIGHVEDGHLYITDRKKSMLKLSTGKYVAPQPIEAELETQRTIEQAMVIGDDRKFCAALLVPDRAALRHHLALDADDASDEDLIQREDARDLIQRDVNEVNQNLPHWEQVKAFQVIPQPLSVEAGELTPTLKVKRRVVKQKYSDLIDSIYS